MKILLINPPSIEKIEEEVPGIVNEERGYNPPLGLLYIASMLLKYTDAKVKVIDAQVEEMNFNQIRQQIQAIKPDIIGMTVMTFTLLDVLEVIKVAREVNSSIKIILGGPHPHIYPNETLNLTKADYLIIGEGEKPIVNLVKNINHPEKLKNFPGLVFKHKNQVINTGPEQLIQNLDEIPFPDRTLTDYKKYTSLLSKKSPITTMITSRGCPYKCKFCDRPHLGKMFRARTAQNVVDEIQQCKELGMQEILIYDDTFTVDKKRVIDICNKIIKNKIDIEWEIRARVNTIDQFLLKKMKKAGCQRIHYGVESGNQEILNKMEKGITLNQVKTAFRLTKKEKIETLAYFMIGSEGDTKSTIMQTIDFAKKLKPDYCHFTITTPFPATELYRQGLRTGIIKRDYWREFAKNPVKNFKGPVWEENLTREELEKFLNKAYSSFYLRPNYVLKRLTKVRTFEELKKKAKAGLKVLKL